MRGGELTGFYDEQQHDVTRAKDKLVAEQRKAAHFV